MNQADSASGYTVMTADQSGIVSYSYDGMESYTQDDMTPELFSARNYEKTQLSAGMKIDSASPAYKLIYDDNWQIVICPTADQYKRLKELDTVNLQLQRDNITDNISQLIIQIIHRRIITIVIFLFERQNLFPNITIVTAIQRQC